MSHFVGPGSLACRLTGRSKTWWWASHNNLADIVRKAFQNLQVPIAERMLAVATSDLGCPLRYQGAARLGKLGDRLQKAKARLQRLKLSPVDLDVKAQVISTSVYTVAFHGAELFPLGQQHTQAANAVCSTCYPELTDEWLQQAECRKKEMAQLKEFYKLALALQIHRKQAEAHVPAALNPQEPHPMRQAAHFSQVFTHWQVDNPWRLNGAAVRDSNFFERSSWGASLMHCMLA